MPYHHFHFNVTQADIETGLRNNSYHCAVSQAIARTLPDAKFISTDIQTIRFSLAELGVRYVFLTPPKVQEYVAAFDAGDSLQPFSFILGRPAWQSSRWTGRTTNPKKLSPEDTVAKVRTPDGGVTLVKAKRPAPQMVASSRRVYGLRVMRVNQEQVTP